MYANGLAPRLALRATLVWGAVVATGAVAVTTVGCLGNPDSVGPGGKGGNGGKGGGAATSGQAGTHGGAGANGAAGTSAPAGAAGSNGTAGTTSTTGAGDSDGSANGTAGTMGGAGTNGVSGRGGGGSAGTNGSAGTTGATGSAGHAGTNGTAGTSGASGAGGSTGLAGTSGTSPTSCTIGPASNGSGSFTYYWFGQGTAKDGGGYRTACGYYGTESGQTDKIENIASMSPATDTYFVAIPGTNGFNSSGYCGACVQLTGQNGKQIIATVIDECPYGGDGNNSACQSNPNGHLDVSKAAFDQLGYSIGNPKSTSWKFVPCPVTGNVKLRVKPGNANEIFIENVITAISSVKINGQQANRQSYGAWHVASNIPGGATLEITDKAGRTIAVTLTSTSMGQNQDSGRQFPGCL